MKRALFLFAVFLFIIVAFTNNAVAEGKKFLIVFDASGSMLEAFGSTNRITAAKSAVSDLLGSLDSSIQVGLRPYADVKKSAKADACTQTTLAIPFTSDRSAVSSKVDALEAVGTYTPTAYALTQAKNDFKVGDDNSLILLTDGKETCGGDPAAAAKALLDAGIKVKTYVIGIDVDAEAKSQLSGVAAAGGGKYFDAKDATSLAGGLKSIQAFEKPIDKTNTDSSIPLIQGGNGYDMALRIEPGRYHLTHHQKSGDFDYFKLNVPKNTPITFKVISGEDGVYYVASEGVFKPLASGSIVNNDNKIAEISAGMKVVDEDHSTLASLSVSGYDGGKKDEAEYTLKKDGVIYLLVGSQSKYGDMAKNSIFSVEIGNSNSNGLVTNTTDDSSQTTTSAPLESINPNASSDGSFSVNGKAVSGTEFWNTIKWYVYGIGGAGLVFTILIIWLIVHFVRAHRRKKAMQIGTSVMPQTPVYTAPTPVTSMPPQVPPQPPVPPSVPPTNPPLQ